jgi:hypothetical protein
MKGESKMLAHQQRSALLIAIPCLLLSLGYAQTAPTMSADELARAVVNNELKISDANQSRWTYLAEKDEAGKKQTKRVIETAYGSLERVIAVDGTPLTPERQREETDRVARLAKNPGELKKLELSKRKDADQCRAFFKMIPETFIFAYGGQSGELVRLTFKPNPNYEPPTREGRVLHHMSGEMWVHPRQLRLGAMYGTLLDDVKFGGGILGHLNKGGQFVVKRAEIAAGRWEMTELLVNMTGKALCFKSIAVQQKEERTDFQQVPDGSTLADAAVLLNHPTFVASNSQGMLKASR